MGVPEWAVSAISGMRRSLREVWLPFPLTASFLWLRFAVANTVRDDPARRHTTHDTTVRPSSLRRVGDWLPVVWVILLPESKKGFGAHVPPSHKVITPPYLLLSNSPLTSSLNPPHYLFSSVCMRQTEPNWPRALENDAHRALHNYGA
jgi:hypothetical protein